MTLELTPDCPDSARLMLTAEKAARAAGAYISEQFQGLIEVDHKTRQSDVVTVHDRHAEQMIRSIILDEAPHSRICGEEYGADGSGEVTWFVDPIDGTSNYAGGLPFYCVSIGINWRGRLVGGVVYDPEREEMFSGSAQGLFVNGRKTESRAHAQDGDAVCLTNFPHEGLADPAGLTQLGTLFSAFRAVRRLGSAALALAYVAAGRADLCAELTTHPWDHAAGAALVVAAGGGFDGRDRDHKPTQDVADVASYVAFGRGFDFPNSLYAAVLAGAAGSAT
jgi:myo-inositol-1(or 4)-monophosphatase